MDEFLDLSKPKPGRFCPAVGSQTVEVCLPVTIAPYASTGPIKIDCCGVPHVDPACKHCHGKVNGVCEFTISQKIYVEIPVKFGASVNVGDTYVECGCPRVEEDGEPCDCDKDFEDDFEDEEFEEELNKDL